MRKQISFFLFLLMVSNAIQSQNWLHSLEDAKKKAIIENKLILVDFWATWCGPCNKMDSSTWSNTEVKSLMLNFIPVKIDLDSNRALANKYDVRAIPYVLILDANGKVIYDKVGYKDKIKMLKVLKKYALNTSFLQEALAAYYKTKNEENTLLLAEKYQDYVIYLDKEVKSKFLSVARDYLKMASKLIKKGSNSKPMLQRVALLTLNDKILKGKYENVLKVINEDIDYEKVSDINKPLYNYIAFICNKKLANKEKALEYYNRFKKDKKLVMKARKFLIQS